MVKLQLDNGILAARSFEARNGRNIGQLLQVSGEQAVNGIISFAVK